MERRQRLHPSTLSCPLSLVVLLAMAVSPLWWKLPLDSPHHDSRSFQKAPILGSGNITSPHQPSDTTVGTVCCAVIFWVPPFLFGGWALSSPMWLIPLLNSLCWKACSVYIISCWVQTGIEPKPQHKMRLKVKATQSCPTLCNPMDYTVHGIPQARILEWVAFSFSRGSSQLRDQIQVSRIAGRFLPAEPQRKPCGLGSLSLFQWIFPTQELNQGLLDCRWILYQLSYQGNNFYFSW